MISNQMAKTTVRSVELFYLHLLCRTFAGISPVQSWFVMGYRQRMLHNKIIKTISYGFKSEASNQVVGGSSLIAISYELNELQKLPFPKGS